MSTRRARRSGVTASRAASALAVLALALALSACGVKSAPRHPEGSTYPRDYPTSGDAKAEPEDKAKQGTVQTPIPRYDYPNRPPPR